LDVFPDLLYENDYLYLRFTESGDKLAIVSLVGPTYVYNYNRCNGQLSNKITLESCNLCSNTTSINDAHFSPDGTKLYVARSDSLIQYDLNNLPTSFDRHIVWHCEDYYGSFQDLIYNLQLTPNEAGIVVGTYVLDDTLPNDSGSHYLGIIRSPNSAGLACNFDRYGIYLNGYKSHKILPFIPNYDLGPWVGSPCDTLTTTSISEQSTKPKITLAPNPAQTEATLTWSGVAEGTFVLRDMLGRAVLREQLNTPNGTTRLDLSALPKGIYLWQVDSTTFTKNGKLVVE
jgi:hypothetical protein